MSTAYTATQAATYDEDRFTSPGGNWIHRQELEMVLFGAAFAQREDKMLEVGCGTGRLMDPLTGRGYDVYGVDASWHMIARAQAKFTSLFHLRTANADDLPFLNNTFGFTYSLRTVSLLESVDYAMDAIREMIRVVRPGGYILIGLEHSYRPRVRALRLPHKALVRACKDAGATLVCTRGRMIFGIPFHLHAPRWLHRLMAPVDSLTSRMFPNAANQRYYLLRKRTAIDYP